MAEAVAEALLNKRTPSTCEGPAPGSRKTVAYLTPAILYALGGKPVIVSTHTIDLQGQLVSPRGYSDDRAR